MKVKSYNDSLLKLQGLTKFGINLGLERITSLLDHLDRPQEKVGCIHIGGTNGKGSVIAMLSSILGTAGYKVGAFTSPHLDSYTERFTINGVAIGEEEFARYFSEVLEFYEEVKEEIGEAPTEFEVLTAMAFLYFAREKVDVLLLEVGLGGDIDSTNVIRKPILSIITNVTLDHCSYLGDTPQEIAARKSGIIKQECPVITASIDRDVLAVIRQTAQKKSAPLYEVYEESSWELMKELPEQTVEEIGSGIREGQHFSISSSFRGKGQFFLPLEGAHQLVNAATAILAVDVLRSFKVSEADLRQGLSTVSWPGRLEKLQERPDIYLDGAHNPAGIEALASWLQRSGERYSKIILVIGMLDDKDQSAVSLLETFIDTVIVTHPFSDRARKWESLADHFQKQGKEVILVKEPTEAVRKARAMASPTDLILVAGSLYLIGQLRQLLHS